GVLKSAHHPHPAVFHDAKIMTIEVRQAGSQCQSDLRIPRSENTKRFEHVKSAANQEIAFLLVPGVCEYEVNLIVVLVPLPALGQLDSQGGIENFCRDLLVFE